MTDTGSFESCLEKLTTVLDDQAVPYALFSGLAVATWGLPRATEDIDLLAGTRPSEKLEAALRSAGFGIQWRQGGPEDPIPLLLRLFSTGPEIDIVCATRKWEWEMLGRAVQVRLPTGLKAWIIAIADLIVLKLLAGGPRDLIDVADLLHHGGVPPPSYTNGPRIGESLIYSSRS